MIEFYGTDQSTGEIRTNFIDFSADMPSGVTVASAAAALTSYPSGGTASVTVGVIASNIVPVTITSPTAAGQYIVDVTATLSDAEKSVARLIVQVYWPATRSTMAGVIAQLRSMTDAGVSDYTIGGMRHWSDGQLQDVLDLYRKNIDDYVLNANPRYESGTLVYKEYLAPFQWMEGGTAVTVQDANHADVSGTLYSVDTIRGMITFTADQAGSAYYLYGRCYDLNAAAADVWRRKAAHAAQAIDFSTDNHSVKRSHLADAYMKQASFYAARAGLGMSASLIYERTDLAGWRGDDRD